jgi:hypothetical protein
MSAVVRDLMKHTYYRTLTSALIATMLLSIDSAVASSTCEELVTTCFVSSPEERDECIQTASATSTCETSALHALVSKRAQFATINDVPQEGPAFLGPQIVDQRCLSQFDTTWSAALVNGSLSRESLSSLSAALEHCAKADAPALPQL